MKPAMKTAKEWREAMQAEIALIRHGPPATPEAANTLSEQWIAAIQLDVLAAAEQSRRTDPVRALLRGLQGSHSSLKPTYAQEKNTMTNQAVVLLSGGMNSVAALHWALSENATYGSRYVHVRAIGFDYGQQHGAAELFSAGATARRTGIPFTIFALADTMPTWLGLPGEIRDHDDALLGTNSAYIPNRNGIFLNVAASHACAWFPNGNIDLVFAANADDRQGFPDCRLVYLSEVASALRKGCARQIDIVAPWVRLTKRQVLDWTRTFDTEAVLDVCRSWSCNRGQASGPCGTCTACIVRARAFDGSGLADLSTHPAATSGDHARETR